MEVIEFYIMAQQPTINTQANCQQLIMSHLSQDGADEAILPFLSVWPLRPSHLFCDEK